MDFVFVKSTFLIVFLKAVVFAISLRVNSDENSYLYASD